MSEHIRSEDCPQGSAPPYPGKKTKKNVEGVEQSKSEYTDKIISDWVGHFVNKERYQNTPWSVKTRYLKRYLKPLGVGMQVAKEKLIAVERKAAEEMDTVEIIDEEMEIDVRPGPDSTQRAKDSYIRDCLELTDHELFERARDLPDYVINSIRYKHREKDYFLAMPDDELFGRYEQVSVYTRSTSEFTERYREFVDKYMDDNFSQSSSQDILMKQSQTPASVQSSEVYKSRLSHLSYEQRSERLVMKSIRETVNELNKTPEGKKQADICIPGVSHPVYGDPGLGLNLSRKNATKEMKAKLLSGEEVTLKKPVSKRRQIFPKSVEEIAREHWLENTIPEPAKHTGKAVEEGGETVPKRYQDRTDDECYVQFRESCAGKVHCEMIKVAEEMVDKLTTRKDSIDKHRRLVYAQELPEKFPSLSWYIRQRPPETKPLCDHTTGLCHICEAARKNFDSLVKAAKNKCSCSLKSCPMWFCVCPLPENDDDEDMPCSCPPCECDICSSCQVS